MLKEKDIYDNWMKRFGYPVSELEKSSNRGFGKIKKLTPISEKSFLRQIGYQKLLIIGDDASIEAQQEIFLKTILPVFRTKKVMVITNRSDKFMLAALKSRKIKVHTIKSGSVSAQNKAMFKVLADNWEKFDHVMIWTGHLRLGSSEFQKLFGNLESANIYLQSNGLKWKFPKASGWNRFDHSFVWMDSSPLISVDHFRSSEEKDFVMIRPEMITPVLLQMMKLIAQTMKQKKYAQPKFIHHIFDHVSLNKLNKLQKKSLREFIHKRVMNGESAAIPSEKIILLSTLNSSHMAEEAAHYLRTANHKNIHYGPAMTLIEEALAFFASLLLFPNRRIPNIKDVRSTWDQVHASGYALGFKIWKLWKKSKKSRPLIQKLWAMHPSNDLEAQMMFSALMDLK